MSFAVNTASLPAVAAGPTPVPAPVSSTAAPSAPPSAPPSATVTLSPQALTLSHASAPAANPAPSPAAAPAPAASPASIYEELKNGIGAAVDDVEGAISGAAHWVADGVESAVAGADRLAHGIVELPFALGAKAFDAVGSAIDAI